MKNVLRYILPLLCFVILMSSSELVMSDGGISEAVPEVMATNDVSISTDDPECIPIRPTSSVNGGQRVQKSSRQNNSNQRRYSAFLKAGKVIHLSLYDNTYVNQNLRPTAFPLAIHRLISLGRLVI